VHLCEFKDQMIAFQQRYEREIISVRRKFIAQNRQIILSYAKNNKNHSSMVEIKDSGCKER